MTVATAAAVSALATLNKIVSSPLEQQFSWPEFP
jgi:hypothetical protein